MSHLDHPYDDRGDYDGDYDADAERFERERNNEEAEAAYEDWLSQQEAEVAYEPALADEDEVLNEGADYNDVDDRCPATGREHFYGRDDPGDKQWQSSDGWHCLECGAAPPPVNDPDDYHDDGGF